MQEFEVKESEVEVSSFERIRGNQLLDLQLDSEIKINTERILTEHGEGRGSLLTILQAIQAEFNYLPAGALPLVACHLKIPLSQVVSVVEFYTSFSMIPRGKHVVTCCLGTACHVRGAESVLQEASQILGIEPGKTSKDRMFSLDSARCLGACALAPIMMIDGEYHGKMTTEELRSILQPLLDEKEAG